MADDVRYLPPPAAATMAMDPTEALTHFQAPHTLADDLRLQLARVTGPRRPICEYLIECLDERGFLDADLAEVAAHRRVPAAEVQAALTTLQGLEPAGVGARDLRECLLLQVERLDPARVPAHAAAYITAFLSRDRPVKPAQVAATLGLSEPEVADIVGFVGQDLYMWPSDLFRDDYAAHGSPHRSCRTRPSPGRARRCACVSCSRGRAICASATPGRASISNCARRRRGRRESERVSEGVQRARAFIDHLRRREVMLKRVTEAIVQAQREFFCHGRQALVPLTRKEIAGAVGVHESTVSRITAGKFVQLPNMQFVPYDFFFDASVSAKSVLRSLIEREERQRPLSDAALAERLQATGFPLARRTVAKYRDQLGIPGARLRRGRFSIVERGG